MTWNTVKKTQSMIKFEIPKLADASTMSSLEAESNAEERIAHKPCNTDHLCHFDETANVIPVSSICRNISVMKVSQNWICCKQRTASAKVMCISFALRLLSRWKARASPMPAKANGTEKSTVICST